MIQSKLPNFGNTIFSKMSALAVQHQAINLGQGFADYSMNMELCDLVNFYMQKNANQYAPMPGVLELRNEIAKKVDLLYTKICNPNTEITITPGGTYAIYTAITAIVNKGDEVIILEPAYDSYLANIAMNGGIAIRVPLNTPSFSVDWQKVKEAVSIKTKAIIVNTPHNPGSYIFTKDDWNNLSDIVADSNIFIISDEVYEHIVMDGFAHESILKYPELWSRSFAIFSFGKVYHNTGWKIGYCIAPENLMLEYRKIHQFIAFAVNTPMQFALADFMKNEHEYLQLPKFFQAKRDLFLNGIKETKFTLHQKARGSFFQTLGYEKISNLGDEDFCIWLTEKIGVTAIPVSAFYKDAKDDQLIRFCFAKKEETILSAFQRLKGL